MNWRVYKYILLGTLARIPGIHAALRRGTGGSTSARYCYSIWMRHAVLSNLAGHRLAEASAVAELGPGDSLGIGICALLSGAETYAALDALPHANHGTNLRVFDEILELFRTRAPIPDNREFPLAHPVLDDYSFPSNLFNDARLTCSLDPSRVADIRSDLARLGGRFQYFPTWYQMDVASRLPRVDAILSQAVLEHVDELAGAYRAMFDLLAPGGSMSHQIDFKSHGTSEFWNGHLAFGNKTWQLMRGGLPYFLNRMGPSHHMKAAADAGFQQVSLRRVLRPDGRTPRVAPEFQHWPEVDQITAGAFLTAVRPAGTGEPV